MMTVFGRRTPVQKTDPSKYIIMYKPRITYGQSTVMDSCACFVRVRTAHKHTTHSVCVCVRAPPHKPPANALLFGLTRIACAACVCTLKWTINISLKRMHRLASARPAMRCSVRALCARLACIAAWAYECFRAPKTLSCPTSARRQIWQAGGRADRAGAVWRAERSALSGRRSNGLLVWLHTRITGNREMHARTHARTLAVTFICKLYAYRVRVYPTAVCVCVLGRCRFGMLYTPHSGA